MAKELVAPKWVKDMETWHAAVAVLKRKGKQSLEAAVLIYKNMTSIAAAA